MIEVKQLQMISEDRPTQWQGVVGGEGSVYIRYRGGELQVYFSETSRDASKHGSLIFNRKVGGRYDGQMNTGDMKTPLSEVCSFG